MDNPFRRIRRALGWTIAQAACRCDVSPSTWVAAEAGAVRCPARIARALAAWGYDPEALLREFDSWRRSVRRAAEAGDAAR